MTTPILYTVCLSDLPGHHVDIRIDVVHPNAEGQYFSLPVWIPGSYLIREFSRHVGEVRLSHAGGALHIDKCDKHRWLGEAHAGAITLTYRVYGWDTSVRTAYIGTERVFLNGACLLMAVTDQTTSVCELRLEGPTWLTQNVEAPIQLEMASTEKLKQRLASWQVHTALPCIKTAQPPHAFGHYRAPDYDALIDAPIEIGDAQEVRFEAHHAPHRFVLTNGLKQTDFNVLKQDLQRLCETQIALFEPRSKRAPFLDSNHFYSFLCTAISGGYGGLEHRASCALLVTPEDLPLQHQIKQSEAYRGFLGLVSHEYFHQWWVKRVKPAAFASYDLHQENYTRLLWIFEGFTSYYDDLLLVRSGVISFEDYLRGLSKTISQLLRTPGRLQQSLVESSYDAWIRYYRPDETSADSSVSYYIKGALAALCLDMEIRTLTADKRSLDDVLRFCWQQYGRDFYTHSRRGIDETGFAEIVLKSCGVDLHHWLSMYVETAGELPLEAALARVGLLLKIKRASEKPTLNIKVTRQAENLQIASVYQDGAAHRAGLAAFDVLVAIDGQRVCASRIDALLSRYQIGDTVEVHAFRQECLWQGHVVLGQEPLTEASVEIDPTAGALIQRRRRRWLHAKSLAE